jgi:tRNA (cmo5U34)-methyltransferase
MRLLGVEAVSGRGVGPRPPARAARVEMPLVLLRERLANSASERTPEPMVMDEAHSVAEFHEAGADVNLSVYEFCARRLLCRSAAVLDIGCGSGQYLAHLARRRPDISIRGLALSEPMLATGREMLERERRRWRPRRAS